MKKELSIFSVGLLLYAISFVLISVFRVFDSFAVTNRWVPVLVPGGSRETLILPLTRTVESSHPTPIPARNTIAMSRNKLPGSKRIFSDS
jgi:hypothetical protein